MPNCLISDNEWINQHFSRYVFFWNFSGGRLTWPGKAYDPVHPGYLQRVLSTSFWLSSLITVISTLFFQKRLGSSIPQLQGLLRQGDPLLTLLFNLTFEPILRSVLANSLFGNDFFY